MYTETDIVLVFLEVKVWWEESHESHFILVKSATIGDMNRSCCRAETPNRDMGKWGKTSRILKLRSEQ